MTFTLTLSPSDLLLLLPEILLTSWLCLILIVDFSFPRLAQRALGLFQHQRARWAPSPAWPGSISPA